MSTPRLLIATVRSPTIEHVVEMREQALMAGVPVEMLDFGANTYSLGIDEERERESSESILINEPNDLRDVISDSAANVILFQSPYSEHYPDWLLDLVMETASVYAGYGIALSNWSAGHFETPLINATKYLIASSKYEESGYTNANKDATVMLAGNPLLWRIRCLSSVQSDNCSANRDLLWAPHWTTSWFGSRGFARFSTALGPIREWVKQNPSRTLTVRPHPLLRYALDTRHDTLKHPTASQLDDILDNVETLEAWDNLLSLPNVMLSEDSFVHDIVTHNALVTDGVSIIAYFSSTGKPLCVYFDEESPRFNDHGMQLLESADVVDSASSLWTWLNSDEIGRKDTNEFRLNLTSMLFPTFTQSPIQIWAERFFILKS